MPAVSATDWQPHQGICLSSDSYGPVVQSSSRSQHGSGRSGGVAILTLEAAQMLSLDDGQHKASVSHANSQRAGVDSRTGLKCTWLDLFFFAPGENFAIVSSLLEDSPRNML